MVYSRWPEPRKSKKKKIADHMSTESDKSPNGVCNFYFLIFEVFAWSAPDGQNLENKKKQKKNCRPHVHRVRQEPQWALQFCLLFFFDFRGFCMVYSRWPEPRKCKKKPKTKTADHMSTESDKSPNGVCSFVLLFFFGFCMVCSRWPEPRTSKKQQKTKLQTTCPQSQTRAPMGSAVLCFGFFLIFEVFAWSAPDGQNLENQKNKKQNCRPHVHRVRQEPQWGCILLLSYQIALCSAKSM